MKLSAVCFEKSSKRSKTVFAVVIILILGAGTAGLKLIAVPSTEAIASSKDARLQNTEKGISVAQNEADDLKSFEKCRQGAEKGILAAQYDLAIMYESGKGVAQDKNRAFEWFQKAAVAGHPDALFDLGYKYYTGDHGATTPDYAKAFDYYQKAAVAGHSDVHWRIGLMYVCGEGVKQDDAKAFECYQKGAAAGCPKSKFRLGYMYEHGRGVTKDDAQAAEWYQKANLQNGLNK